METFKIEWMKYSLSSSMTIEFTIYTLDSISSSTKLYHGVTPFLTCMIFSNSSIYTTSSFVFMPPKVLFCCPWHSCPMAVFRNLNHILIFFGARALFIPRAIQLARSSFLAPMLVHVNVQESQYDALKLLKQDPSRGYKTCDMCEGNVISFNPICLAIITTSIITCFACHSILKRCQLSKDMFPPIFYT